METVKSSTFMEEWAEFLSGEMLVFGLLGKILYQAPQADWLTSLAEEGVFNDIPLGAETPEINAGLQLLREWSQVYLQDHSGNLHSALEGDYNRLFVGPAKVLAPPWESVYSNTDRLIFQEQTLQVRNWYWKFGLEVEKLYQEPDDHIGLELIFVAHLASLALRSLEAQDENEFDQLLKAQKDFLTEHPLHWAFEWIKDVQAFSRLDFYKGVALLVKGGLLTVQTTFERYPGAD